MADERPVFPIGVSLQCEYPRQPHTVFALAWDSEGRRLASGSFDGSVTTWAPPASVPEKQFQAHEASVNGVAWSPDSTLLVTASNDKTIRLWNTGSWLQIASLSGHEGWVDCVAFSSDGRYLASGSHDHSLRLWNPIEGRCVLTLEGHTAPITACSWHPTDHLIATVSQDETIRIWDIDGGRQLYTWSGHKEWIHSVAWARSGDWLVTASGDGVCLVWEYPTGGILHTLQGHSHLVTAVAISEDDRLIASKSWDGTVRFWSAETGELVGVLTEHARTNLKSPVAFTKGKEHILATLGSGSYGIRIWNLDYDGLGLNYARAHSCSYAKVAFVGPSGVGKTCLVRALTGEPFEPQESTAGMEVHRLARFQRRASTAAGEVVDREISLWDFAGQMDYELSNSVFLADASLAIVVIDGSRTDDLIASIEPVIQRLTSHRIGTIVVATRADRGQPASQLDVLQEQVQSFGGLGLHLTSSKTGYGVTSLREAILNTIDWGRLEVVRSSPVWQSLLNKIRELGASGEVLLSARQLMQQFVVDIQGKISPRTDYENALRRAVRLGIVDLVAQDNYVLLRPELLSLYAEAIIRAARNDPRKLGGIDEWELRKGGLSKYLSNKIEDSLAAVAIFDRVIELFLEEEIAFREDGRVIFPTKASKLSDESEYGHLVPVAFCAVRGNTEHWISRLVIRGKYTGFFDSIEPTRRGVFFRSGPILIYCRFAPRDSGSVDLHIYSPPDGNRLPQVTAFLRFMSAFVAGEAPQSRLVAAIYCDKCGTWIRQLDLVEQRLASGFAYITCQVCDQRIRLKSTELDCGTPAAALLEAKVQSSKQVAISELVLSQASDVFLCHNKNDKAEVRRLAEEFVEHGVRPWLDEWDIAPGDPWILELERQLERCKTALLIFGKWGIGPWMDEERQVLLRRSVRNNIRLIPVILPSAVGDISLPPFLAGRHVVDMRMAVPNPIRQLIWGITGKRQSET